MLVTHLGGRRLGGPPVHVVELKTLVLSEPPIVTVTLAWVAACVTITVDRSLPLMLTDAVPALAPLPLLVATLASVPEKLTEPVPATAPTTLGSSTRVSLPNASEKDLFTLPAGSDAVTIWPE